MVTTRAALQAVETGEGRHGLELSRYFTTEGVHPYDELDWELRDAVINDWRTGEATFEQRDVEFPVSWSANATTIVAQKYFRGPLGTPKRERSVKQMIDRVADTITDWGRQDGYFANEDSADVFNAELKHLLVNQKAAFNSPVWFNVGVEETPQCSACQPWDALVSTPAGLVPIGELVERDAIGTKVYDANGVTKVVATKHNGRKQVLRIHLKNGAALDVTPDHLVWRSRGSGSGQFVEAGTLQPGDRLEWHRTYAHGRGEITERGITEAALAGDQAVGPDASVPQDLFTAPLPVVAAYVRSLFQAEGYVSVRERSARVALDMISEQLVRGVQALLMRFGIFSCVSFKKDARQGRHGCWSLAISNLGDRLAFRDEIGFLDDRKAARLEASLALEGKHTAGTKRLTIDRIEDRGVMDVYDIQTESGEYLSGNLRVHNCFILSVEDTMASILNWYVEEGTIFKGGSGSGVNLSKIRSSKERLRGGGEASGPVSFMRGADASAGTIKCLHADTQLSTDAGIRRIADIEPGERVLTRYGFKVVHKVHDNGTRDLVRVRTALGDELLCTPEHRFWVRTHDGEGWREAKDLGPDDYLVLDLGATTHGVLQELRPVEKGHHNELVHELPDVLDEAVGLWLGWFFGDGWVTAKGVANVIAVQVGDSDPELVDRYKALTRTVFGERIHLFTDRHADKSDQSMSVRFCSTQIIRFLRENGLLKQSADALRVPDRVKASPATARAAFLAGLFEADGHIGNGYPWLSTSSEEFANDVHRLLLSIGIPSIVSRIDDRRMAYGERPISTVRIVSGEGVRRFAKLVGFVSERKSRLVEQAVARKDASPYETQWMLPHVGAELDEVRQRSHQGLRRDLAPYSRYSPRRCMSLLRARSLVERWPSLWFTSLGQFASGRFFYVQASVESVGDGPVYDLTVEDVHEYLVHNLITHNSGGKTRRAAKMVILDVNHPDIEEFIWCKAREEAKVKALREAGFDMDLDGPDYASIQYQNANNSVRVTDEFMRAVEADRDFDLIGVTDGEVKQTLKARELMRQIAQAAWECADPGMQYDTTINDWHTTPNAGRINGSNPCSEYMHLDNSACNLASLNLRKFEHGGVFDVEAFQRAVEIIFTAQEIIVGNSSYPTDKIGENARAYRQLGLGYANLGGLLLSQGIPYDSDEGRAWAGAITALMTGHAYRTSAELARVQGPFDGYAKDRDGMLRVIAKHKDAADDIDEALTPAKVLRAAKQSWADALQLGTEHGIRNAQASVLAPTGCLVGGTLVPSVRGLVRLESLGDPAGPQWQDLDVDVATDEGPRQATKFYVNGLESVVTVDTTRGYRIQGTPKHRIKVVQPDGSWVWKRFGDLDEGDRVPLALDQLVGEPQEVRLPPLAEAYWTGERQATAPRRMTPELAEIVGYFMGDGSLHARGLRLCVDAKDFEVVERLARLAKELFNLEAHVSEQSGYTEVAFHSVRLVEWWEAVGFAKQEPQAGHSGKSWEPHIPGAVLHANDRAVYAAFLRGLFEADGTVTAGYPHWSTTSRRFSQDVQALLLALGYPTTRKVDTTGWGESELFVLRLLNTGYHARWLDEVGFLSGRKQSAVHVGDGQQAARKDHIPMTRALVDRVAPDNGRLRRVLLAQVARHGMVSRRIAEEALEASGDPELEQLLGFFYDTVAAVELGEDELTYDLSVPDNVTYVANGFVSHNTIGLMMDCDTTGIEPDLGLVKMKKLVGGGSMRIVNRTVPVALEKLGYQPEQIEAIVSYIDEHSTIEDAPALREEHLPVFDCAMGDRSIAPTGHIKMMAAVQPWLSGAISKTINIPESATVEDIEDVFIQGWKLGLKAVAVYRDNCKAAQPLSIDKKKAEPAATSEQAQIVRRRLPKQRPSQTFSFAVGDAEGYLTAGEYPGDGLGEIFVKLGKQGSTLSGVMDAFAISVSLGLQYGVPLEAYVSKFTNMRFEPAGMTDDAEVKFASSIVDYIFRRLAIEYLPAEKRHELGIYTLAERNAQLDGAYGAMPAGPQSDDAEPIADAEGQTVLPIERPTPVDDVYGDAPMCYSCGVKMVRAGSCHVCEQCGTTSGCS